MNHGLSLIALFCLMLATNQSACAQPAAVEVEKPDPQLQEILKKFPEADANKDGVLTRDEANAHRRKLQTDNARNRAGLTNPIWTDVRYGPAERNVLDFYQAKSTKPTPLVIQIHGGGFVAGDKSMAPGLVKMFLDAGISVASINYRFVDGKDVIFPAPQHDGARALQFLRSKAGEWNIDPKRVACFGGSAGAGISMWIGFHDDLADPKNDDPILHQSTRIQAIATFGGQGTYDPIQIKELIGGRAWEHPSLFKVYGVTTTDEALHPTAEKQKLYDESSAITHLTKDDPPLFMVYSEPDGPLPEDAKPGQGIHHPNFGKQLKKKMDDLGIENVYVYTPGTQGRNINMEMLEFFQKAFARVKD